MEAEELCVCAEPLIDRALYPCGHALCIDCTLKKRVLQKSLQCPYCRTPADLVVVVSGDEKSIPESTNGLPGVSKASLVCENPQLQKKIQHILRYPCPICGKQHQKYHILKEHLTSTHKKTICDVCTRHELQFSEEYELFPLTSGNLPQHLKQKHIKCKYCSHAWFYGTEDFAKHCRDNHEYCPVCEREDPARPRYFESYEKLRDHMRGDHFMCHVPQCLDERYIVFATDLDLQHHMIEEHPMLVKGTANGRNGRKSLQVVLNEGESRAEDRAIRQSRQNHASNDNSVDPKTLAAQRFKARLEIDAKHDKSIILQINTANETYSQKPIPLSVHLLTYQRLLPNASPREITLLLQEYSNSIDLPETKKREISVTLSQRQSKEREEEEKSIEEKFASRSTSAGPTRMSSPIVHGGWSSSHIAGISPSGRGALENLPRLPSRSKPSFMTAPVRPSGLSNGSMGYKKKVSPLTNLPSLGRGSSTASNVNNTPASSSKSKQKQRGPWDVTHGVSYLDIADPTAGIYSSTSSPGPSSLNSSRSASPMPSWSSTPNNSNVDLNQLPSLPSNTDRKKKMAKGRVLRLV